MTKEGSPLLPFCGFLRVRGSQLFGNRLLIMLQSKTQGIISQLKMY